MAGFERDAWAAVVEPWGDSGLQQHLKPRDNWVWLRHDAGWDVAVRIIRDPLLSHARLRNPVLSFLKAVGI